jgi:RHS repeat-associated protein
MNTITLYKLLLENKPSLLVASLAYTNGTWYTYTGQEQDEFGGLIYYNARWYDPEVGRFISEDPAAALPTNPLSINRYVYCMNNPLIYVDPTGLWSIGLKIFGFGFSIGDQGMSVSIPFLTIGVNFTDGSMYGFAGLDLSSGIELGVASIGYTAKAGVQVDKHGTYGTASGSVYASALGAVASFGAHYASLDGRVNVGGGFDYNLDLGDLTPEKKPVAHEQDMTLVEPESKLVFDRDNSTLTMYDVDGNQVGQWTAYNNVTNPGESPGKLNGNSYAPNGKHSLGTTIYHSDANDIVSMGGGRIPINISSRSGIAIHSGRGNPAHMTNGCIRTTDMAFGQIAFAMSWYKVKTIEIRGSYTPH